MDGAKITSATEVEELPRLSDTVGQERSEKEQNNYFTIIILLLPPSLCGYIYCLESYGKFIFVRSDGMTYST